jgi:ABC-type transport system involved in multi-copper enzyme maturation permease subunit
MSALLDRVGSFFADPNPILVKELRATFRTALYERFLYLATGAVALLVLAIGAFGASDDVPPASVGRMLFQLFLGAGLLVISLVAPGYASAAITAEREQETWESLELSGMSAWRIVWGKLAACYASIALVLVALSPIVGIAFLFGGVSPGEVLVGFVSLLVALVPAIAFGIAISARLRSKRIAVVLATVTFVPLVLMGVSLLGVLSEKAALEWGVGMRGPFFYTEAFVTRLDEPDTWILLLGLPMYALGMPSWFLVASAVSGLRAPADDRAGPMKIWALAMSITSAPIAAAVVSQAGPSEDWAIAAVMLLGVLLLVYGLLFTNEPALPSRGWIVRQVALPRWRRSLGVLGAGAAGTMRFSIALSFSTAVLFTGSVIAARNALGYPSYQEDFACVVLATGAFVISALAASLGAWIRIGSRSGLAARVATISGLSAAAVLPFLLALLIDIDAIRHLDRETPAAVMLSPVHFIVVAMCAATRTYGRVDDGEVAVSLGLYGALAIAFVVLVELAVRRAARDDAARRARLQEPP